MHLQEHNISSRAFLGLLQILKPKSFRGRCFLDPCRVSGLTPPGALERAPGPHAVRRSARSAFMDSNLLALTLRTNTKFVPTGLIGRKKTYRTYVLKLITPHAPLTDSEHLRNSCHNVHTVSPNHAAHYIHSKTGTGLGTVW